MKLRHSIILIILFFCTPNSYGQLSNELFKKVPQGSGLRNNTIITMVEDNRGYVWYGTWVGLFRKDGAGFKQYTSDLSDSLALHSNKIVSSLFDSKGRLWIGSLREGLYRYNYGTDQFINIRNPNDLTYGPEDNIWALREDTDGLIWIGTEQGVLIYDPIKKSYQENGALLNSRIQNSIVYDIFRDRNGTMWLGTDQGVFQFKKSSQGTIYEVAHYQFSFSNFEVEESNFITFLIEDEMDSDQLLVGSKAGLISLTKEDGNYKRLLDSKKNFAFPRKIANYSKLGSSYLIGTQNGLFQIDKQSKKIQAKFLPNTIIRSLYEDQFGLFWVGTESGSGLLKLDLNDLFIHNLTLKNPAIDLEAEIVGIYQSPKTKDLWLGWISGELTKIKWTGKQYDLEAVKHYNLYLKEGQVFKERLSQIKVDSAGRIWIASQGEGLLMIRETKLQDENNVEIDLQIDKSKGLSDNYLMSLAIDGEDLWLGSWSGGLNKFNIPNNIVSRVNFTESPQLDLSAFPIVELAITSLKQGRNLWMGIRGAGNYMFEIQENQHLKPLKWFQAKAKQSNILKSNFTNQILPDQNKVWFITEKDICYYDLHTQELKESPFSSEQVSGIVQSMMISQDGNIWISNSKGEIYEYSQKGNEYSGKVYINPETNVYPNTTVLKDHDGKIIFGGYNGISIINEAAKRAINIAPIPIFTDFKIDNKSILLGQKVHNKVKLKNVIEETRILQLDHKDKIFSISFSGIHSEDPFKLTYAYQLEGFHKDWVYTNEGNTIAHFTQLRSGTYTFKVKVSNSDGIWSPEKRLIIDVAPPWWLSPFAFAGYGFIFLLSMFGIWRIIIIKTNYDNQLRLEKLERTKLEELNQMKLQFYTSISHDLRTPLTLILSPIEDILEKNINPVLQEKFQLIHRNAMKLSEMINQLLEFRKYENGNAKLAFSQQDIIEFCHEALLTFEPIAQKKELNLVFESNLNHFQMAFDKAQMDRVLNNLITNSIKFSSPGGTIKLNLQKRENQDEISIQISDNGIGIPKEDLPNVFKRFYKSKNNQSTGYGIGLALVNNIIKHHQGSITVTSQLHEGSIFAILLPTNLTPAQSVISEQKVIQLNRPMSEETSLIKVSNSIASTSLSENDQAKILIVEDNHDIRQYLAQSLQEKYTIWQAPNGELAWEIIQEHLPDIVISDIAMPEMDGLELCKKIKENELSNHIPVILLTARASKENKYKGYNTGADVYITKPFNLEILNLRIVNLLKLKQNLHQTFQQQLKKIDFSPSKIQELSHNEEFVQKIIQIIEKEMENDSFTVEDLAKGILMSRVQFYRKLKAVTGLTPNVFIRQIRLKRAVQLLETRKYSISEITYKVGFQDLKYFRAKFKEFYGLNPSEYLEKKIS